MCAPVFVIVLLKFGQEEILTCTSVVHRARPDDKTRLYSASKSNLNLDVPAVAYQVHLYTGDSPSACRTREDLNKVSNSLLSTALSLFGLRVIQQVLARLPDTRGTIYALDECSPCKGYDCVAHSILTKHNSQAFGHGNRGQRF